MNSRFKFRVWDKGNKRYQGTQDWQPYLDTDGDVCFINTDDVRNYPPENYFIIEQCTGLKDKNGNLIYIGDIIKCGNGPLNTATVEYANGENFIDGIYPFNLYHDCGDECHCQLRDYPEYACEIIGNIHEQAEQKDK